MAYKHLHKPPLHGQRSHDSSARSKATAGPIQTGTNSKSGLPRYLREAPAPAPARGEVDLSQDRLVPESFQPDESGRILARLPGLAAGSIQLVQTGSTYSSKGEGSAIPLTLPSLEWVEGLVLVVQVRDNTISGYVSLGKGNDAFVSRRDMQLFGNILGNPGALRLGGLSNITVKPTKNTLQGGVLNLGARLDYTVGGWVSGSGEIAFANGNMSFGGNATVELPGGSGGEMQVKWDKEVGLSGEASLKVSLGKVSGGVAARLHDGVVDAQGTVGYAGDKLTGSITLVAIDAEAARNFHKMDPQAGELPAGAEGGGAPAAGSKAGPRAFAGWGELDFALTEWFTGRAKVVVNSTGEATIKGEIAPPKEITLFEQKDWTRSLAKAEVRASYGIPVVGNVFLFANIGLEALATIGPGKLYNIKLSGQYSTDKAVDRELSLQATLNISAFAGLRLRAEGGAGLELLGHDIKAGVGVWALAGVRGYVEATPTIGYREKGGGPGEFYIKGHMELAAQPFLGLGGDLFVEVDSPWWSPLGDEKWTWPLGSLEYPLPGEFGIGADVEHVLGSKQWPSVSFTEVEFDSSRFMGDLLNGGAGGKGKGGEEKKPAKWAEGGGGGSADAGAQGKGGAAGGGKGAGAGGGGGGAGPQSTGKGKGKGKGKGAEAKGKGAHGKGKGAQGKGKGAEGKGKGKGKGKGQAPGQQGVGDSIPFSAGREPHRLYFVTQGSDAVLMVASTPTPVEARLNDFKARLEGSSKDGKDKQLEHFSDYNTRQRALGLINQAMPLAKKLNDNADKLVRDQRKAQESQPQPPAPEANEKIVKQERSLASLLSELYELFGERPGDEQLDLRAPYGGAAGAGELSFERRGEDSKTAYVVASGPIIGHAKGAARGRVLKELDALNQELGKPAQESKLLPAPEGARAPLATLKEKTVEAEKAGNKYLRQKPDQLAVAQSNLQAAAAAASKLAQFKRVGGGEIVERAVTTLAKEKKQGQQGQGSAGSEGRTLFELSAELHQQLAEDSEIVRQQDAQLAASQTQHQAQSPEEQPDEEQGPKRTSRTMTIKPGYGAVARGKKPSRVKVGQEFTPAVSTTYAGSLVKALGTYEEIKAAIIRAGGRFGPELLRVLHGGPTPTRQGKKQRVEFKIQRLDKKTQTVKERTKDRSQFLAEVAVLFHVEMARATVAWAFAVPGLLAANTAEEAAAALSTSVFPHALKGFMEEYRTRGPAVFDEASASLFKQIQVQFKEQYGFEEGMQVILAAEKIQSAVDTVKAKLTELYERAVQEAKQT